jgi:hypothetical protein
MSTSRKSLGPPVLLRDARVYLSGPMDFVASREEEKKHGWRTRVAAFLTRLGATVFDPWNKPEVRGLHEYGREDETTTRRRASWSFEQGKAGARRRARCAETFWPALHMDLRMVDTSDFVIAYVPTNIYSVGTVHEIIQARQQRKPVLFVSPQVHFPALVELEKHLRQQQDSRGLELLGQLRDEAPIKPNENGAPSLWYMPLVGGEHFFDGFGFSDYREQFGWGESPLDQRERDVALCKPLLPFLEGLNRELPKKWNRQLGKFDVNDDWLLWKLKDTGQGKTLAGGPG